MSVFNRKPYWPARKVSRGYVGRALGTLACLFLACASLSAAAEPAATTLDGPKEVVEGTLEQLRTAVISRHDEIVRDPILALVVVDTIVTPHVDVEQVARSVLGKHWRGASDAQRQRFTEEFRRLLLRMYSIQVTEYTAIEIVYQPAQIASSGTEAVVPTRVALPDRQPIPIDYRLRNRDGAWKVYDIVVDGISLISTYRSTFSEEVNRNGFDGLIARLAEKNRQAVSAAGTSLSLGNAHGPARQTGAAVAAGKR